MVFRTISHYDSQIILLGDADSIIEHLCERLEWTLPPAKAGQYLSGQSPLLTKRRSQEHIEHAPKRVADRYVKSLRYMRPTDTSSVMYGFSRVRRAESGCWTSRWHNCERRSHLILSKAFCPRHRYQRFQWTRRVTGRGHGCYDVPLSYESTSLPT